MSRMDVITRRVRSTLRGAAARYLPERPARSVGTLAPEAERWMSLRVPDTEVLVTGVSGGVGASTVATLLRSSLRLWRTGDGEVTVTDVGIEPWLGGAQLDDPGQVVVVVCPAHERGLVAAAEAVRRIAERTADDEVHRRVVIAVVASSGPGCGSRRALSVAARVTNAQVVVIGQCKEIAPGNFTTDVARLDVAGPLTALTAAVVCAARSRCPVGA